jgi:hypothetical protein
MVGQIVCFFFDSSATVQQHFINVNLIHWVYEFHWASLHFTSSSMLSFLDDCRDGFLAALEHFLKYLLLVFEFSFEFHASDLQSHQSWDLIRWRGCFLRRNGVFLSSVLVLFACSATHLANQIISCIVFAKKLDLLFWETRFVDSEVQIEL